MARSKEFEESAVLNKAMRLFWEQGYEKTSLNDLVETMGIHRRSMYDTFGDKHTLFLKAMERYGEMTDAAFQGGVVRAETAAQAIRFIFDYTIESGADNPAGCLYVNTAVELAVRDAEVGEAAVKGFDKAERLLAELIRKGQQEGEFTADRDADELAEHLHNSLLGIRVLKRTSADKAKLERIARLSLSLLEK